MIDVREVVENLPHLDTFCSVEKLRRLVERLREDPRFEIRMAGSSVKGVPIHHVRFGTGSVRALFVAGPHAMEPIGSLTVFCLMSLLHQGNEALLAADVEWHIVPCIDPDGAILNEGWTQKPFTLESHLRYRFVQAAQDQVDQSFPITYKKVSWNQPSKEAGILKDLLDEIHPDFYFSLHSAWAGGAFYFLSRDIGQRYYQEIYELLQEYKFPVQKRPIWKEVCPPYSEGIVEILTIRKYYDHLEKTVPNPEAQVQAGAPSSDYLAEINPNALTLVAEMGHVRHPADESDKKTGQNLRKFMLRLDADSKYLAAMLLEEWERVKGDLDPENPLYRAVVGGKLFPLEKEKLVAGEFPISWYPTRDLLFNPQYDREMTEGDRFNACMVDGGFLLPLYSYQFVRLLRHSPQTSAVQSAITRLARAYETALVEIDRHVDFSAFEVFDCDTLAKVQLGSGLIVLNSLFQA